MNIISHPSELEWVEGDLPDPKSIPYDCWALAWVVGKIPKEDYEKSLKTRHPLPDPKEVNGSLYTITSATPQNNRYNALHWDFTSCGYDEVKYWAWIHKGTNLGHYEHNNKQRISIHRPGFKVKKRYVLYLIGDRINDLNVYVHMKFVMCPSIKLIPSSDLKLKGSDKIIDVGFPCPVCAEYTLIAEDLESMIVTCIKCKGKIRTENYSRLNNWSIGDKVIVCFDL